MIKMIAGSDAHSVAHRTVSRTAADFPRSTTLRVQFNWNVSFFATALAFRWGARDRRHASCTLL